MKLLQSTLILVCVSILQIIQAQPHTVARLWNEELLKSIRKDFARPTVHARNLFHTSAAMYDAWAVFDEEANPFFLGNTINGFNIPFNGFTPGSDIEAQRNEAISFAMYRLLRHRFNFSPGAVASKASYDHLMDSLGYNKSFTSVNYSTGNPAALGNYIAARIIAFGLQDGSREQNSYTNAYYQPVNPGLTTIIPGNSTIVNPNRWQPLILGLFIDQSGNMIPGSQPPFLSAEWGNVVPFSLHDSVKVVYQRDGQNWNVYHDPGSPVLIDTNSVENSQLYKETFGLVLQWSSHLGTGDGVMVDISPGAKGNVPYLPETPEDYSEFYNYMDGFTVGNGRPLNPITGLSYPSNIVKRGDFTRVLAEFWADGPQSETPPGHWFTLLNYVNDHSQFEKKYKGQGSELNELEWDVKSYFMLGGSMHDAAISTWGIKGYYDHLRPISALRYMLDKGQCTDSLLPSYHPAGINLIPGFVEIIMAGDPLQGDSSENIGKIKVKAWRGPDYIPDPLTTVAEVGWILGEYWWPYQRPTFVTPPFGGYISGHSTYSRTAAELLTELTGTEYFPGGVGEFVAEQNEYLVFEEGPTEDVVLQWATYRDAADQSSLSRIWGGIHPPIDDIPGRKNGIVIAANAFKKAEKYFFDDIDGDGYLSYYDCNDNDSLIYPTAIEICDFIDNDCDTLIDEGVKTKYYADEDFDGEGNINSDSLDCFVPAGFVTNNLDCDDSNININTQIIEICDEIDNDCDYLIDEGCGCTNILAHNYNENAILDDGSCETCDDDLLNGDEVAIDCGGETCSTCPPPTAICGNIITVYANASNLIYNGPGASDVYLISTESLDDGSIYYGTISNWQVKRKYTNIAFNWTTNGACIDSSPNGVYNNNDKGLVFRNCLPVAPADFNKIRNFDMTITDQFGTSICDGRYIVIFGYPLSGNSNPIFDSNLELALTTSDEFSVFPNPGVDQIFIKTDIKDNTEKSLIIYDAMGKQVLKIKSIKTSLLNIDTHNFSNGSYTITLISNQRTQSIRWIKAE